MDSFQIFILLTFCLILYVWLKWSKLRVNLVDQKLDVQGCVCVCACICNVLTTLWFCCRSGSMFTGIFLVFVLLPLRCVWLADVSEGLLYKSDWQKQNLWGGLWSLWFSSLFKVYFPWDQILILFVSATEKYFSTFLNKRGYFQVLQWWVSKAL